MDIKKFQQLVAPVNENGERFNPLLAAGDLAAEVAAVSALFQVGASKQQKAMAAAMLARSGHGMWSRWSDCRRAQRESIESREKSTPYCVTIANSDPLYALVLRWLYETDQEARMTVRARGTWGDDTPGQGRFVDDGDKKAFRVTIRDDPSESFRRDVTINGHEVVVVCGLVSTSSSDSGKGMQAKHTYSRDIELRTRDLAGQRAVVELLNSLAATVDQRVRRSFWSDQWGDTAAEVARDRPLDSVILENGVAESLVSDLRLFLESESRYALVGAPWHRGYLFYGPPGTGKSSLAQGLATELELDVAFLTLSSINDDGELQRIVRGLPQRTLIVFEDIDTVRAAQDGAPQGERSRDADGKSRTGVTLNGLLNVLDGPQSPNGAIFVLTTNYPERVEQRLLRAGRVDYRVEVGHLTSSQLHRLWERVTGEADVDFPPVPPGVTPADVMNAFKRHIVTPSEAYDDICTLLRVRAEVTL